LKMRKKKAVLKKKEKERDLTYRKRRGKERVKKVALFPISEAEMRKRA